MTGNVNIGRTGFFEGGNKERAKGAILKLVAMKKDLVRAATVMSEMLADKTAREGLFGEDRKYGYSGTDVDFISENAIEIGHINLD